MVLIRKRKRRKPPKRKTSAKYVVKRRRRKGYTVGTYFRTQKRGGGSYRLEVGGYWVEPSTQKFYVLRGKRVLKFKKKKPRKIPKNSRIRRLPRAF